MTDAVDQLFSDPLRAPGPFRFDRDVVEVFPDMIRRSVPGYETVIAMTGLLAGRFARPGTCLYDLGCSLGASTLSMHRHVDTEDCTIVGIDSSAAMIERCGQIRAQVQGTPAIELQEADLLDIGFRTCSVAVLNYTLQFVPLHERLPLLERIHDALVPGGVLILSEKVVFPDPTLNQINIDLHHDFKRAHGYSDLEIAGKRDSLENVLVPETLDDHRQRLSAAGFQSMDVWFQCFNFASLIALR